MSESIYDIIVVGKGLIGAAAAKYISRHHANILVVGADEPANNHDAIVYASHYDQGRVQRIVGRDTVWTRLNIDSAKQYKQLQQESGLEFHYPVGCLYATAHEQDNYLAHLHEQAARFDFPYRLYNGEELQTAFPDFHFPENIRANFEAAPSGHINPRKLIEAQLTVCKKNGGTVISDTVVQVKPVHDIFQITTASKNIYKAKKVLLAPGAFTNFLSLMQQKLWLQLKSETIVQAKVTAEEAARLSKLPSLLYEITTDELDEIYLIRPIQYPDGNYYLKIGCNLTNDKYFSTLEEVQQWFRNGDSEMNLPVLKQALQEVMPHLMVQEYIAKRCIITYTKHRKQYISETDCKGLYIATGGNGYSAMCSDALGNIASHVVINNSFPAGYCAEDFIPVWME
ncbi:MAG TPA: FAD-dependent oxidoreductase [Chitinophagaceae bacterium]|nr:FAD-dependent oxidoreductase [Chitinophagaceae bacterium]